MVVGLGQCSLDILGQLVVYPGLDEKAELSNLLIQGGGPVATALVTLARLGIATAIIGWTGGDDFGRQIVAGLEAEGVDCRYLHVDQQGRSQLAFIAVDAAGHRNIFWHRGSAGAHDTLELPYKLIRAATVLHLDGLHLEASLAAAKAAKAAGVTTVLDSGTRRPGIEELLPLIDHLVVGENFSRAFAPGANPVEAIETLAQWNAQAVTITMGKDGSLTRRADGTTFFQPAFPVATVDTTGCGDVFHGGYIYGLLQGWCLEEVVRFAAACAALKARSLGGRTGIPALPEVESFLRETILCG